jgi:hypothetical protein
MVVDISSFHMADGGLLLIFRGMSTDDLLAAQQKLMAQFIAMGPYGSMSVGGKSFTKDARFLQGQLEAIQFVLNERGTPGPYEGFVITDFSAGMPQGQPAGTTDQLSY